jgi:hypothetical protein
MRLRFGKLRRTRGCTKIVSTGLQTRAVRRLNEQGPFRTALDSGRLWRAILTDLGLFLKQRA